ncbi:uncharacterized protein KGF55_001433 [Candida pseudojiufengensis]|uniref:uncharacterized protein n=1 Tax=Candida pseudojiufengensis TaxID=497109 RepID=UPI002225219E|nr:uncharacterized protein KGF55_001433 [Candida pseudojiufengensis]KAI5965213.1 hypothetical protein KGF55_001433 [Candida pseudojiufengensis]
MNDPGQSLPSFDINFIKINQLAYKFNKTITIDNEYNEQLIDISSQCLELMEKYQALNPSYILMISYLQSTQTQNITRSTHKSQVQYDETWALQINQKFEKSRLMLNKDIAAYNDQSQGLKTEESVNLFQKIKTIVIKLVIQNNYEDALTYLNQFANLVDFSSQPKTKEQFKNNKYIEFLFFRYVINLFSLIWFPNNNDSNEKNLEIFDDDAGIPSNAISTTSFKALTKIYNLSITYHSKNILLFDEQDDETKYFHTISLMNLAVLFKQFQFIDFYKEFTSLFLSNNESSKYLFSNFLSGQSFMRETLLAMYLIALMFVKPFGALRSIILDNEEIADLICEDPNTIEFKLYNLIIKPLSKFNIIEVKKNLQSVQLNLEIISTIGYLFPKSNSKESTQDPFLSYAHRMIDLKNFLLVLSNCSRVSKSDLFRLLGYDVRVSDVENSSTLTELTESFIMVMSALQLGKVGIKYSIQDEVFINSFDESHLKKEMVKTQGEIDNLTIDITAESTCALLTNVLTEKYFQLEE